MSAAIRNPHAIARLAKPMIQRTERGVTPAQAITAPIPALELQDLDKGLLPQRDRYFAQSKATRDGAVAPY
jgi:hypothetical protein